jgi:hypothetical protein
MFVCGEECVSLESFNGKNIVAELVDDLKSNQEEADTRIILHCLHIARDSSDDCVITVRSPDTDVFILLLHFTSGLQQKVLFDTGVGNNRCQIDLQKVSQNVGKEMCSALLSTACFQWLRFN